jgi:hypothetical protein
MELLKAVLLSIAFFLWAANQLWPDFPQATLFNDLAIALFVLDVFFVMIGWPATASDKSLAEISSPPPPEKKAECSSDATLAK